MRGPSCWFAPLLVTACCLLALAGCGSEGGGMGQPDGGSSGDGGAGGDPGGGGTGGVGGAAEVGGAGGAGGTSGTGGTGGTFRFHPPDFERPDVHGPDMELQRMDCRDCHAADLTGNLGPSCDSCHTVGWRWDCVFCHGADDNLTGAPPRDLGALPMSGSLAFLAHTVHVNEGISQAYDCTECHRKPSNVLSIEHAFDDTPGQGEVRFSMGLSAAGNYNGVGACSSLYCHGNGRGNNGSAVDGSASMQCDSCHPGMAASENQLDTMSGEHSKHVREGLNCGNCHLDVTEDGLSIRGPLLHVDGANQIRFTDLAINYNPATGRCAGDCHGKEHEDKSW